MVHLHTPSVIYPSAVAVYVFHFQLNTCCVTRVLCVAQRQLMVLCSVPFGIAPKKFFFTPITVTEIPILRNNTRP
jgi:hypothetical protein